jgi:hypothetical protein
MSATEERDGGAERAGFRQALFREVNERIFELGGLTRAEIVCECHDETCTDPIDVSAAEYEQVRGRANRFIVKSGHHAPEVERVVAENDGHVIVENLGVAAETATRLDPRRRPPTSNRIAL